MKTCFLPGLVQRLLPRAARIARGPFSCRPVSPATVAMLAIQAGAPPEAPVPPSPGEASEELSESAAVEMCNFLHRIGLGIRSLRAVAGADSVARSMGLAMEQLRQQMRAGRVEFADLTGHPWNPDRPDFECIGTPKARLGLENAVIESCQCPAVTIRGELVQKARGEAVRPPMANHDE